ncbi:hypothetical protein BRAO375_1700025 [Bradyrhizobium sp. ORS 375]|uniref:hypothetical protein n=1 Tax=Bradyrhizobium sp. (strain ORS 375) TaxID=566679 RepID=UPI000240ACF6|nr:hypothetical protein [Bradyrhizobium sp. ORS 375]CCD91754.1 hypothetical protein BRAO375_1700025 [Bradyrhizobium sp. ORS 375]
MKRSGLNYFDDAHEDRCGMQGADYHLQEQIALLIDENEKLRRIAAELANQTRRHRRSSLSSS